ncbi:energy-coupling factor transporter transmembrane protein EcfT [Sanguibacter suaedae]|uniref:Energy-coupling factor transporter transmembrane protein EcfT n=1 Tax=Sanguibacter suaedae TaxID=2795737 RepID=A0A934I2X2_9MICO|nr:energy-coupling factor transporter transmembrane protein EcfT [Sanguibacter suaedae]MBI9114228.1 energy-coupling factor transporter transmembrane protein EcfT [Sanguibacter suaedae]
MTVHPAAWWVWALVLVGAAAATTNLLVLALLVAVVGLVVSVHGTDRRRDFRLYLVVAASVVVLRTVFRVVFPADRGEPVLTLPSVDIGPLHLFGPVSAEALLSGVSGGMQLAAMILAIGAAHCLADPLELLKHAPPALAGLSTALVIAVSVFPQLTRSVHDVRRAARLRGGRSGVRGTLVPVLEGAMDRSLALAAAMEARGFGGARGTSRPRSQTALVLGATVLLGFAAYGLLDDAWPSWAPVAFVGCAVLCGGGAVVLDRSARRTVYRPTPWTLGANVTVGCAVLAALGLLALVPADIRTPAPDRVPDLTWAGLVAPIVAGSPVLLRPSRTVAS